MASHKSALKQMRADKKRRERNRAHRSELKTIIKRVRADVASTKGKPEAAAVVKTASSILDKKASKGIIHRNAAARTKSRIARAASKSAQAK